MRILFAFGKYSIILLTLQESMRFKKKTHKWVEGNLDLNLNLSPLVGKLLVLIGFHFLDL